MTPFSFPGARIVTLVRAGGDRETEETIGATLGLPRALSLRAIGLKTAPVV